MKTDLEYDCIYSFMSASQVKNLPANAGDSGHRGLISGSGNPPGVENGNPLQQSCLKNPVDRGAWRAAIRGVAKGRT